MMQRQIIVHLFNGLGNQLFQYAAGLHLADAIGAKLRLVHKNPWGSILRAREARPVLLRQFAIPEPIEPMSALDRLVLSGKPRFKLAAQLVRHASGIQALRQDPRKLARPYEFAVDPRRRVTYLSGYFQEYALVAGVERALRQRLVLRYPLGTRSLQIAERIHAARCPISIHLRLGDYVRTFGSSGLLPMSYYESAIRNMRDHFGDPTFFVFSDDIAFARSWARGQSRVVVVDRNEPACEYEAMHLMSLCRHHIIANSTFSWWGAWLNPASDKRVIAPDDWLGLDTERMPVACPEWRLLSAHRPADHPERVARLLRIA